MGKALMFITFAFTLGTATVYYSTSRATVEAEYNLGVYEEAALAREIAVSGHNTGEERLKRNFATWRAGYDSVSHDSGYYSVRAEGSAVGPVDLVTKGYSDDTGFTLRTRYARLASVPWAVLVDADSASVTYTGSSFMLSGHDVRPPSLTSGSVVGGQAASVEAMQVSESDVFDAFYDAIGVGQGDRIAGANGSSDIMQDTAPAWLETAYAEILANATAYTGDQSWFNQTMGSQDSPVLLAVEGNVSMTNVSGYGVLLVQGSVALSGTSTWEGLIWVRADGDVSVDLSGSAALYGALVAQQSTVEEEVTVVDEDTCDYTKPDAPEPTGSYVDPDNSKKRLICHIPPGNPANAHTISVSSNAVKTHFDHHGDYDGPCECTPATTTETVVIGVLDFSLGGSAVVRYSAEALGRLAEDLSDFGAYTSIVMLNHYAAPSKIDDHRSQSSQTGSGGPAQPGGN